MVDRNHNGHDPHKYDGAGQDPDWHIRGDDSDPVAVIREQFGAGSTEPDDETIRAGLEFARDIIISKRTDYVVKGAFGPKDIGALFSESGVGKSFVAKRLANHIARGEPIFGSKTRAGAVLYVGYEGLGRLPWRMKAANDEYGDAGPMVARLTLPAQLDKSGLGEAGLRTIINACRHLKEIAGVPVVLVVIDTYGRATAGNEENSNPDANLFLEQRAKPLAQATGAAVLIVHHCGKGNTVEMRGAGALHGGADFIMRIDADKESKAHTLVLQKSRDSEERPLCTYKLRQVVLGTDDEGDPQTTCVVDFLDQPKGETISVRQKLPVSARRALDALETMFIDKETVEVSTADLDFKPARAGEKKAVVRLADWQKKCAKKGLCSDTKPHTKYDSERRAFQRASDKIEKAGLSGRFGDYVWAIGQRRTSERAAGTLGNPSCGQTGQVRTLAMSGACPKGRTPLPDNPDNTL